MELSAPCAPSANRKTRQIGVRLFADQLDELAKLRTHKHRQRRSVASLIREALDQYIEQESQRPL